MGVVGRDEVGYYLFVRVCVRGSREKTFVCVKCVKINYVRKIEISCQKFVMEKYRTVKCSSRKCSFEKCSCA